MTTSSGTPSAKAQATPVKRLVEPGPEVPAQTASFPVVRANPSAMNAAPSSCRATTSDISGSRSTAAKNGWSRPPGMPKTWRTPSALR
ncbi:MAG: hypothetical protein QM765_48665 [Myxococcales bacterium]